MAYGTALGNFNASAIGVLFATTGLATGDQLSVGSHFGTDQATAKAAVVTAMPAIALTLSANTVGAGRTMTAASAAFAASNVGDRIVSSFGGDATITGFTDTTHVTVTVNSVFFSTAISSGEWGIAEQGWGTPVYVKNASTGGIGCTIKKVAGATIPANYGILWGAIAGPADVSAILISNTGRGTPGTEVATTGGALAAKPISVAATGYTAAAGDDVVGFYFWDYSNNGAVWTVTPPGSYTTRLSQGLSGAFFGMSAFTRDNLSAGATGSITGSANTVTGGYTGAGSAIILPLPASGPPPAANADMILLLAA